MNTFPLIRTKWTNEHFMAAAFIVLMLYMLPSWVQKPLGILDFFAVILVSLIIDGAVNFIRYRRPICGVSAALTAGILCVLTPGTALWVQLIGAAVSLLLGKHIWGGTGKNPINPAMTGVLITGLLFGQRVVDFSPQLLLIPALLLSIPFILFRPYASLGLMAGMAAALVLLQKFGFDSYLGYGAIFYGCLVLTDPVTVSPNPVLGAAGGALTGAAAIVLTGSPVVMAASILLFNVICYIADKYLEIPQRKVPAKKVVKKIVTAGNEVLFYDLSLSGSEAAAVVESITPDGYEILSRIEKNEVTGLGGAAFPTIQKIRTVLEANEEKKYFIINGVECDPGLMHDHWLIDRRMEEICTGISLVQQCIDFEIAALAVKEGTQIKACNVNVVKVPDYYPVGAEKTLISHVLGKDLTNTDIPAKKGILVLNVQTVFSIYEAVIKNKRADTKLITISDLKTKTAYVAKVRLGMSVQNVIEKLPLSSGNIFLGGGVMQCWNFSDDDVIDRNVNFIAIADFPRYKESVQCSGCGFCVENCPMGMDVKRISQLIDRHKTEEAKKYHPERCIQCGNCSRVCLAGRNIALRMKSAKAAAVTRYIHNE